MMIRLVRQTLDKIPYSPLVIASIVLGLAPFQPQPHVQEKILMLISGELTRWIDIFDLFFHLTPLLLLLLKFVTSYATAKSSN